MKMRVAGMFAVVAISLAGCGEKPAVERPAVSPAARVVGEPQNCIQRTHYRETRVRDDWTIDFLRDSRSGWRNTLPNRCPGLRSSDAFTFRTSINQICSTDIINVLQMVGSRPTQGAGCGLGRFAPIEIER